MDRRLSTLGLVALIAASAGCSATLPVSSAAPTATPGPTQPAPTASPAGSESPLVVTAPPTTEPPVASVATVRLGCEEPLPCQVSRLDAEGTPMPGWPIQVANFCSGTATDGLDRVYVACEGGEAGSTIHGFDAAGAVAEGWPVDLPAPIGTVTLNDFTAICGRILSPLALASDGVLYMSTWDESKRLLHAFDPNGTERRGWPRPLPADDEFGCGGFAVLADGTVRAWGYEGPPPVELELGYGPFAQRTVFTAFGADGATLPGWPIESDGTGSGALIGADGTLYHVSENGDVWARGADGRPKPGWPHEPGERSMTPYLAPDGRLVLLSSFGSGTIIALGADGKVVAGWPQRLLVSRASPCVFFGDTDCFSLVDPVFGSDGRLHLALAPIADGLGGSILALGPDGRVPSGWPFQLPDGIHATGMSVDRAGNLEVVTATCDDPCWETAEFGSLVITPEGTIDG
jgi:hypothetical protein